MNIGYAFWCERGYMHMRRVYLHCTKTNHRHVGVPFGFLSIASELSQPRQHTHALPAVGARVANLHLHRHAVGALQLVGRARAKLKGQVLLY